MKWFADDYDARRKKRVKFLNGSLHFYKLYHMQCKPDWRPSLDLYETERNLIVLVDMAGMQPEDVQINLGREHLRLRGNRYKFPEPKIIRIHHMEIDFGPYDQTIALPKAVDPSGATSSYRNGFLVVRLPKEVKSAGSNP